ncbi:MAG: N-formylglutamate amidohydrolase [Rudaea sp.]|uniref:N-formylglutamate amidohydrolase n=1 Tax=Rudaea sp. TaxID=2136325 RepID=UPI0039E67B1F
MSAVAGIDAATAAPARLIAADEPPPYSIKNANGTSPFLLTCDHAGRRLPRALGNLGLDGRELERHIAWDIGAAEVTSHLAARLDAFAIAQTYSRLVVDCNRPLASPTLIATRSERTDIPGNANLTDAQRRQRVDEVFRPYHARIEAELDARRAAGRRTILVTVHSFTPAYLDVSRPWQAGILYHHDTRLAHALLHLIRAEGEWVVGDNEPYSVSDTSDYAIPVYGTQRGLANVELEIRQDLIADADGQAAWGERVAAWLLRAGADAGLI